MEGLDNQIAGKESLTLQVTACIVFVPVMDIDGFKVISHEDAMDIQGPNWWRWRTLKLLHFRTNWDQLEKVKVTQFVWYHWKTETIVLKQRRIDIEPTDQV